MISAPQASNGLENREKASSARRIKLIGSTSTANMRWAQPTCNAIDPLGSHPLKTAEMRAHRGLVVDATAAAGINGVSLGVNQGEKIAQDPRLNFLSFSVSTG